MSVKQVIDEHVVYGYRLGRHINHDDESWMYPAAMAPTLKSVKHKRHCAPYNQGDIGSCTGNMAAGLLMTDPFYVKGRKFDEEVALDIYSEATHFDKVRGVYPPDDTGSSGLAVMKVCKNKGWIKAYRHAFGLDMALRALVVAPVGFGVPWYEGFDEPTKKGECRIDGAVRGGHEIVADGIDVENKQVWLTQSWGNEWGGLKNGKFFWTFDTVDQLLHDQGDVITADVLLARQL